MKLNNIYHIDVIDGLKQLKDESVDIIIIDPPYNIGKDFGNNKDNLDLNNYINWSSEWISESIRILKDTGSIFIYGYSEILAHLSSMIPLNKRWLIWSYTNKNTPACNTWQRSHESIIYTHKNKPIFNKDNIRVPYTDKFINGSGGNKRKSTKGIFTHSDNAESYFNVHPNGALPRDVLNFPALSGVIGNKERWFLDEDGIIHHPSEITQYRDKKILKHPTQKPMSLTNYLIKSCQPNERGTIVIPFSGSGSECYVSKILGHDFIGFDNNDLFVSMGNQLINSNWTFDLK